MKRGIFLLLTILVMLTFWGCPKKTEPVVPLTEETPEPPTEIIVEPEPEIQPQEPVRNIELRTVYFEFDQYDLTEEAKSVLKDNAQELMEFPDQNVLLEGHCDERGTEQYNLSLGQKRAESVKQFLVNYGVSDARIRTISFGEERPTCKQNTESCWSRNRRVEFLAE